jgi:hypothetical protein
MNPSESYAVSDFDGLNIRTNLLYDSDALVAQDNASKKGMFIGTADTGVSELEESLVPTDVASRGSLDDFTGARTSVDSEFKCHCAG